MFSENTLSGLGSLTPHLSLRGNSRTGATFPAHKKSHNPQPQQEGGRGVKMGTERWGVKCMGGHFRVVLGECWPRWFRVFSESTLSGCR